MFSGPDLAAGVGGWEDADCDALAAGVGGRGAAGRPEGASGPREAAFSVAAAPVWVGWKTLDEGPNGLRECRTFSE
jgi:hypothetical protein